MYSSYDEIVNDYEDPHYFNHCTKCQWIGPVALWTKGQPRPRCPRCRSVNIEQCFVEPRRNRGQPPSPCLPTAHSNTHSVCKNDPARKSLRRSVPSRGWHK